MPDALHPQWLDWPQVRHIVGVCESADVPFCFVGGAVRDALALVTPNDIDIVVGCMSSETEQLLQRAHIPFERVVSRNAIRRVRMEGMQFDFIHFENNKPSRSFEDAVVSYASKADFTINGMVLFPSGKLYDAAGGRQDLAAGRIRFIDNPETQIQNQIHRPQQLRFFRLLAWFGKGKPDARTLQICVKWADKLRDITRRGVVMSELYKLLCAPHPQQAIALMHEHGVWPHVLGVPLIDTDLFKALATVERLHDGTSHWLVRMALLLLSADAQDEEEVLARVAEYLDMLLEDKKKLHYLLEYYASLEVPMPDWEKSALTKRLGREGLQHLLWLAWVMEDDVESSAERYRRALSEVN